MTPYGKTSDEVLKELGVSPEAGPAEKNSAKTNLRKRRKKALRRAFSHNSKT